MDATDDDWDDEDEGATDLEERLEIAFRRTALDAARTPNQETDRGS